MTDYAILASSDARSVGGYLRLSARAVRLESGEPRNLSSDDYGEPDPMTGITVTAQADRDNSDAPAYAYAWRFGLDYDGGVLRPAQVAATLATLRAVERKLSALSDRIGPAATFGAYVARIADALGVPVMTGRAGSDGMYSSGSWNLWRSGEAASIIDGWIIAHRKAAAS